MPNFTQNFTQDFYTSRRNFADGDTRIGEEGRLWYDSITNTIRISNGSLPGGIIVSGAGTGSVTQIDTAGSGLGFSLTGGPITSTGTVTLNIPDAMTLRSELDIGTVASINLNGNVSTVLAGDGTWVVQGGGGYVLPIASSTILGGIKIGSGLTINPDGTLNVSSTVTDAWKTITVQGQQDLVASGNDTLQVVAGDGIWITTNPTATPNPTLTINASYSSNLDGGFPDSVYGGVPYIDAGGV